MTIIEELSLSDPFDRLWQGKDPFLEVDKLEGEVFRHIKTRRTIRFYVDGKAYFVKSHKGIGWYEIAKELVKLKCPVVSAHNEWAALDLLHRLGIDTMTPVAYGRRGWNPARIQSFIVTEELPQTQSLEEYCADWKTRPGPFRLRRALLEQVAFMTGRMHAHGMNHRDCYLCHFHLDTSSGPARMEPDSLRLYVIDLHRAQIRRRTPRRWLVKDLAGLYCSAMDIGLTRTDRLRFVRAYEQRSLRDVFRRRRRGWRWVERTAIALHKKLSRKQGRRLRAILHHT